MKPSQYKSFRRERKIVDGPTTAALLVFSQLKELFTPYRDYFEIAMDSIDEFEAVTKDYIRVRRKSYNTEAVKVSFLLIRLYQKNVKVQFHPLHLEPTLLTELPANLKDQMKKAITFQFDQLDSVTIENLNKLFEQGLKLYKDLKYVR